MNYNRYPVDIENPMGPAKTTYNPVNDLAGFLWFVPSQCKRKQSLLPHKKESPIIALVGNRTEPAMKMMTSYMR